jgi:hypothetical protein
MSGQAPNAFAESATGPSTLQVLGVNYMVNVDGAAVLWALGADAALAFGGLEGRLALRAAERDHGLPADEKPQHADAAGW